MFITLLTLLLTGCGELPNDGGQSGEEGVACTAIDSTEYALGDDTPLGFTGQSVVDLAAGDHLGVLTWASGTPTDLTVGVATTSTSVTWNDNEWTGGDQNGSDNGMEMKALGDCLDDLVLGVDLSFTTADGAFAESWPLELHAATADEVTAYNELNFDALTGTYTVTEVDPTAYDAVTGYLDLSLTAAGPAGTIQGQAETTGDASDPDSTSSATNFEIATFAAR